MTNYVETKGANIYIDDNKYVRIVFKKNVSIEKAHAQEITEAISPLIGDALHGNLIDARQLLFMSSEAREHFASQDNSQIVGVAIIIESRIQVGFANLYMKFTKRKLDTKLFNDIDSAKAWIDTKF